MYICKCINCWEIREDNQQLKQLELLIFIRYKYMTENEILEKYKKLNDLPEGYEFRKKIEGTKFHKYLVPSWMSGLDMDLWLNNREISKKLRQIGLTTQLYYDIMELRISDINERPKCKNDLCNNTCKFYNLLRGYGITCSHSCRSRVSDLEENKNKILREKFVKSRLGATNSKDHREKVSKSRKGMVVPYEVRDKISASMTELMRDPNEILKRISTNKVTRVKHGWIKVSKCDEDIYYGSSWEKFLIELCESSDKVESIHRCEVINYSFEGKSKRYLPDLLIKLANGNFILFEVKPYRQISDPKVQAKARAAIEWCKSEGNYEYRFFSEVDIKLSKRDKYIFY